MPDTVPPIPDDVLDAVKRGNTIEAIKRLREATGLGLKEAKDVIDAQARGGFISDTLPPDAVEALVRGDKIAAIKIVRQHMGVGLKEAKGAVDAAEPTILGDAYQRPVDDGSRGAKMLIWIAVLAIGAAIVYFVRR
jgi:ribosomal protein L7/L12